MADAKDRALADLVALVELRPQIVDCPRCGAIGSMVQMCDGLAPDVFHEERRMTARTKLRAALRVLFEV